MHGGVQQCTVMHSTEEPFQLEGARGVGPQTQVEGSWCFGQGQQECVDPGSTAAAGSPAARITVVSQTEISQAIRPQHWLCREAVGGKLFKSPCYTPAMGSASCGASCPSPALPPSHPLPPSLSKTSEKPLEGQGGPSTTLRVPQLTEQHHPQQPCPPSLVQALWEARKCTQRAALVLGGQAANPSWCQV